jgi:hypothetical protein
VPEANDRVRLLTLTERISSKARRVLVEHDPALAKLELMHMLHEEVVSLEMLIASTALFSAIAIAILLM